MTTAISLALGILAALLALTAMRLNYLNMRRLQKIRRTHDRIVALQAQRDSAATPTNGRSPAQVFLAGLRDTHGDAPAAIAIVLHPPGAETPACIYCSLASPDLIAVIPHALRQLANHVEAGHAEADVRHFVH